MYYTPIIFIAIMMASCDSVTKYKASYIGEGKECPIGVCEAIKNMGHDIYQPVLKTKQIHLSGDCAVDI